MQKTLPILIDQGEADQFLAEQLKPEVLQSIAKDKNLAIDIRLQPGYDHSYYFISSFIEEHIQFHARHLTL